jgi:hypothetical protein
MPSYVITAPDGKEYEITAPEGATQEQVLEYAKAQFATPDESAAETQRLASQPAPQPRSTAEELARQVGLTARGGAKSVMSGFGLGTMVADPLLQMAGQKPASQAIDETLTAIGFPEPEGAVEKGVQTGLEVMTSIGGQAKAAELLSKTASLAPTLSKKVAATVSDDIGQQLAAGVPAATVGDTVFRIATENGIDPAEAGGYALATGVLTGLVTGKGYRGLTAQKQPIFTPEMAKREAAVAYDKVAQMGVTVKPKPITDALDDIQRNLSQTEGGFYPNAIPEHGTVQRLLDEYRTVAKAGPMTFQSLDKLRSNLITLSRETKDASTRRLLGQVVDGIDLKISNLQPSDLAGGKGALKDVLSTVRDARAAWRRGAKATILEDALGVALRKGEAPAASTGELIRTNFKNIYADKKKMKLFTADEQEAIRKVVAGKQSLETLLSFAARFNPQRSQLMAGGLAAGSVANPYVGVPLAVTGFAADKGLAELQKRAAQQVMSQIASGQIPQPRSNASWRALVEAQMQAMQPVEQGE